jgi:hypothetical protein
VSLYDDRGELEDLTIEAKKEKELLDAQLKKLADELFHNWHELQSWHAKVGGKGKDYLNVQESVYLSPNEFITAWYKGLLKTVKEKPFPNASAFKNAHALLSSPKLEKYTKLFLRRMWFRHYDKYLRKKPFPELRTIWFGEPETLHGLLITPVWSDFGKTWCNDLSEIPKANFDYWTIGHVVTTGLVTQVEEVIIPLKNENQVLNYLKKRVIQWSRSTYEKKLWVIYAKWIKEQLDVNSIPLLIPQMRFGGEQMNHKYRLDFAVLNIYKGELMGIELSPHSTHKKFEKYEIDAQKTRDYLKKYGIKIIHFTDKDLKNLEESFENEIVPFLEVGETYEKCTENLKMYRKALKKIVL